MQEPNESARATATGNKARAESLTNPTGVARSTRPPPCPDTAPPSASCVSSSSTSCPKFQLGLGDFLVVVSLLNIGEDSAFYRRNDGEVGVANLVMQFARREELLEHSTAPLSPGAGAARPPEMTGLVPHRFVALLA